MSAHDSDWMAQAACADRPGLPWLHDAEDVAPWDRLVMAAICDACPVGVRCSSFVASAEVTGGFWAGAHREALPQLPDAPAWFTPTLPGLGDVA